jgi:hypothetical protein
MNPYRNRKSLAYFSRLSIEEAKITDSMLNNFQTTLLNRDCTFQTNMICKLSHCTRDAVVGIVKILVIAFTRVQLHAHNLFGNE